MAPMPSIKTNKSNNDSSYLYGDSTDSGSLPSSPPLSSSSSNGADAQVPNVLVEPPSKSQCSSLSDGESYEGYGENDVNMRDSCQTSTSLNHSSSSDGNNNLDGSSAGVELQLSPHGNSTLNT